MAPARRAMAVHPYVCASNLGTRLEGGHRVCFGHHCVLGPYGTVPVTFGRYLILKILTNTQVPEDGPRFSEPPPRSPGDTDAPP